MMMMILMISDLLSPLLYNTKGIVFFSTPHKGSPIVKLNKTTMEKLLKFSPIVNCHAHSYTKLMDIGNAIETRIKRFAGIK